MKGAELPINTLIVIVLGVIILVAVIAIFFGPYFQTAGGVNLETAKSNACNMLASLRCNVNTYTIQINNFDANKDGSKNPGEELAYPPSCLPAGGYDNLARLCICYYGITDEDACIHTVCNCPEDTL